MGAVRPHTHRSKMVPIVRQVCTAACGQGGKGKGLSSVLLFYLSVISLNPFFLLSPGSKFTITASRPLSASVFNICRQYVVLPDPGGPTTNLYDHEAEEEAKGSRS